MENIQGYTLIEKINKNNFAEVFRAERSSDSRKVIIKAFNARYLSSFEIAGLKKDYELVRKAGIKGIVQPLDFLEYDGRYAIVLENFEGIPLNMAFKSHPVSISTFLDIAASVSESLGNLHKISITHMGIKPDNILVNPLDLQVGISCFDVSARLIPAIEKTNHPDMLNNILIYLSPEQTGRMNRQVDYRTDLYSLGVSLYELLTGHPPFLSRDPMEIIHAHLAKKPLPPHQSNPDIPEIISDIVLKLMAKPAEERYQNSFGLLADLQRCIGELKASDTISGFPLGRKDISLTFTIPRKLYGREEEVQCLLKGFDNVCAGTSGVMLAMGS